MSAAPKEYLNIFYAALMSHYANALMLAMACPTLEPKEKALLIVCFGELIKADSAGFVAFTADPD